MLTLKYLLRKGFDVKIEPAPWKTGGQSTGSMGVLEK